MQSATVMEDLQLLLVLSQTRSFTRTASRLGLSKATVSHRIAELEKAAGVPLVRRTTRSVALTEAATRFIQETEQAFQLIEQSYARIRDQAQQPSGLVRVSAPVAFGRQHLGPSLTRFMQRHPDIRIELDLSDRLVSMVQEGFDVAVRHTASPPDTHVAVELARTLNRLVASPAYLKAHGRPGHPEDLAQHRCLAYPRDAGPATWAFERRLRGRKAEVVQATVSGPFKANNSEVLRDAACAGLGVALLPQFSAQKALDDGTLALLLPDWRPVGVFGERIYAIRPYAAQVPRAVQLLVSHLKEDLPGLLAGR